MSCISTLSGIEVLNTGGMPGRHSCFAPSQFRSSVSEYLNVAGRQCEPALDPSYPPSEGPKRGSRSGVQSQDTWPVPIMASWPLPLLSSDLRSCRGWPAMNVEELDGFSLPPSPALRLSPRTRTA